MKSIPKISKYMTPNPFAVNSEATLEEAAEVMHKHKIRHLPVMKNGKLFGLLTERDIKKLLSFAGINPKQTKVESLCEDTPYIANADAMIDAVADEMADKKYGSALVTDNGKLVGIFTAVDACVALADICKKRYHV